MNLADYIDGASPVEEKPPQEQLDYWKERSLFFEQRAYEKLEAVKRLEGGGESWRGGV